MIGTIRKTLRNGRNVALMEPESLGNRVSDDVSLVLSDGSVYSGRIDEIKHRHIWLSPQNGMGEIGFPIFHLVGWFYTQ